MLYSDFLVRYFHVPCVCLFRIVYLYMHTYLFAYLLIRKIKFTAQMLKKKKAGQKENRQILRDNSKFSNKLRC